MSKTAQDYEYVKKEIRREEKYLEGLKKDLENLQNWRGSIRAGYYSAAAILCLAVLVGVLIACHYAIEWGLPEMVWEALRFHEYLGLFALTLIAAPVICLIVFIFACWRMLSYWPFGRIQTSYSVEQDKKRLESEIAQSVKEIACLEQLLTTTT